MRHHQLDTGTKFWSIPDFWLDLKQEFCGECHLKRSVALDLEFHATMDGSCSWLGATIIWLEVSKIVAIMMLTACTKQIGQWRHPFPT